MKLSRIITIIVLFVLAGVAVYYVTSSKNRQLKVTDISETAITVQDIKGDSHHFDLITFIGKADETVGEISGSIDSNLIDTAREKIYILYTVSGQPGRNGTSSGIVAYDTSTRTIEPFLQSGTDALVNNPSDFSITPDSRYLKIDYHMSNGACSLITGTLTWDLDDPSASAQHEQRTEELDGC